MATEGRGLLGMLDFSSESPSQTIWLRYLCIVFAFILFWRLINILGVAYHLQKLILFIYSIATAAGRKRRSERQRLTEELRVMRAELQTINMVQQFAAYSKLERRIKATNRHLDQLSTDTLPFSILRFVKMKILLFVCEGILTAWLTYRAPAETITKFQLDDAELRESIILPLLKILYYLPSKLIVLTWIGLCHSFCASLTSRLVSKQTKSSTPSDTSVHAWDTSQ